MKRALLAGAVMLVLVGCGVAGTETDGRTVRLPDGRTVICVVSDGNKSGGVDCDWAGAR